MGTYLDFITSRLEHAERRLREATSEHERGYWEGKASSYELALDYYKGGIINGKS